MRIVSLLSSATEILFGIGAGENVVAISHECDYPPEAQRLPRATRSLIDSSRPSQEIDDQVKRLIESGEALYEIDRELIGSLQPELIVTQAQCDVCAVRYQDVIEFVAAEPRLAATKVLALNPRHLMQIFEDVLRVGDAAQCVQEAQRFRDELMRRYSRVVNRVRDAVPRGSGVFGGLDRDSKTTQPPPKTPDPFFVPRVAVLEWTQPLMGAGNWTPELVQAAGGEPVLGRKGEHSTYIGWLDVVAARPEVLIVAPCGFNLDRSMTEARRLLDLPGYGDLPAVASGRSFVLDGNAYLNRSGPRIIDTIEILAHLIRPDLFAPPAGELAEGRAWARL